MYVVTLHIYTWDKNTFVARTNSEFANQPVPHKSTNTIWSTSQLANSEFVLVANILLSHVLVSGHKYQLTLTSRLRHWVDLHRWLTYKQGS